jgi:hypothetical protein
MILSMVYLVIGEQVILQLIMLVILVQIKREHN